MYAPDPGWKQRIHLFFIYSLQAIFEMK
jgi:hypothetical protein